jgi:amidohydrolase
MTEPLPVPYAAELGKIIGGMLRNVEGAEALTSPHGGAPAELRERITAAVEGLRDQLVGLSHDIHAHPELGYEEHEAVRAIATLLGKHGHDAEVGAYGVPTALRARAGSGRPCVAILAEYDALPEIGHACGHNVIAATAVGAFLALAEVVDELGGSVELIGTPAEEGGGGKELIARAGGFAEVDAALMAHPFGADAAEHPWLGVRQIEAVFHGMAAHASAMPFLGRNALDAVVTAYQSFAQMRQHMLPTDRIHGIITDGGQKPNVVPERAAAHFFLRSAEPETLRVLSERAREICEAAALATGTRAELRWDPCPVYLPVRNNHALAARYAVNLAPRGRKVLPLGVLPGEISGSTDMGNVSVRVPGIHPLLSIAPPFVTIHTPLFAEHAVSQAADIGCVDGAIGLALTGADFFTDAALRADAQAEFDAAGGVIDPEALLA